MELNKEIRERIFTAADSLHEQSGRESFPTVDAYFRPSRTAFRADRGRCFRLIVDGISA